MKDEDWIMINWFLKEFRVYVFGIINGVYILNGIIYNG